MSCEPRADLDRYLDSELPDSEAAELEAHLRVCSTCAADALHRWRLKRTTQAAGQRYAPRPEFRRRIEQSIGAAKRPRMERQRWVWGLAAASAIGLIAVFMTVWLAQPRGGDQALSELADLHVSTLASAYPVDVVSSDEHTVKPWFQGKLPFSFELPDLRGETPFRLLGGRVTYFQQSPGAHLLFQVREHRLSVFIFRDRPELRRLDFGVPVRRKVSFNMATWVEGDLRYFIVGDVKSTDIRGLSELIQRAGRS